MDYYVLLVVMVPLFCSIKAQINLGTNGTASQKSTYNVMFVASNAVDGDTYTCTITGGDRTEEYESWWRLTLPMGTIYVTDISIWFRDLSFGGVYRYKGFSLYISNSTDNYTGHLCFGDPGTDDTPSYRQIGECNEMGKYLTVFNERPQGIEYVYIEICNMEINGCYKTFFGENCRYSCSPKCFDRHCDPTSGSCIWGCNCLHNNCDGSPKCMEGCKKRFAGEYCNKYNLASDGTATVYNAQGDRQAQLGIDGDKTSGSCLAVSGAGPWWQVDLGVVSAITFIYITYQNNGELCQVRSLKIHEAYEEISVEMV